MIETYGNPIGGGTNIKTLPMQISNLAATAGTDGIAGYIDVSFNEPPATSWDLVKNYIIVYKEGSIPTFPFDGYRVIAGKVAASGKIEKRISSLTFDLLYGIRIFPLSVDNKYQTSVTGSTATATPVAGIKLGKLSIKDRILFPIITNSGKSEYGDEIVWRIIDKNHQGYPTNSVTLITDKIMTIKCFDAREQNSSYSDRRDDGNSYYRVSNIRKWMNSDAEAGKWYSSQHPNDAPPTPANQKYDYNTEYYDKPGFLNMFSQKIIGELLYTELSFARNPIDGTGVDTVTDRIFMPTIKEMGINLSDSTGYPFPNFEDRNSRAFKYSEESVSNLNGQPSNMTANALGNSWTRDAEKSSKFQGHVLLLTSDGSCNLMGAAIPQGVSICCNLSQDFILKTEPRSDGIYEPVLA